METMTAHYGTLQEFQAEAEDISIYLERVDLTFVANETPEEKQVPIFLNVIGSNTYRVLRSLLVPDNPKDQSMAELKTALKTHFEPKRSKVAEHFHFHRHNQKPDETVAEFVAELRRQASCCSFDGYLSEALRDRIVCGLRNEAKQKHLLTKGDVDLANTIEIAQSMEAAQKDTWALKSSSLDLRVGQLFQGSRASRSRATPKPTDSESPTKSCYRCGNPSHFAQNCPHREAICHKCGKKGLLARACRGVGKSKPQTNCLTSDKSKDLASDADPIQTVH